MLMRTAGYYCTPLPHHTHPSTWVVLAPTTNNKYMEMYPDEDSRLLLYTPTPPHPPLPTHPSTWVVLDLTTNNKYMEMYPDEDSRLVLYTPTHPTPPSTWVILDPTINNKYMEMYTDEDSRLVLCTATPHPHLTAQPYPHSLSHPLCWNTLELRSSTWVVLDTTHLSHYPFL